MNDAQIARLQPAPLAPAAGATSIIHVIERAARDTSVDIERLERLIAVYERMKAQEARASFDRALSAMQPKLPAIDENGRIEIKEKNSERVIQATSFALWEDINDVIKPILGSHGFGLSFRCGLAADGKIAVTGILSHEDGHREETTVTLPYDSTGSKNAVQSVGSSTSYGQRYAAKLLLNITSRAPQDRDRDGATVSDAITEDQEQKLNLLMTEVKGNLGAFLAHFKIKKLSELPAAQYDRAIAAIEARRGAKP